MSSNLSDSKQERDLLNRIARLEQQQREAKTLQIQGSDSLELNWVTGQLDMFPSNNTHEQASIAVTAVNGSILHASLLYSFYESSASDANAIGNGLSRDANYRWSCHLDWGHSDADHNDVMIRAWVRNTTGSPQTVICRWELRVILSTVT